jgi:DHA3 family tetracycline resistance protein-like MFS transporter
MARPVVKVIILISLVVGLASEAWDRLYVPSAIDRFEFPRLSGVGGPAVWFGLSAAIGMLLGLAATEMFRRRFPGALSGGVPARLLALCSALHVVAIIVFTLSGSLWLAFAMLWLRTIVGAISEPVESAWLNRNLDPASRATVISMTGQANSIGQAVGGPALGWIGSAVSIQAALLGSALIFSPAIALYRHLSTQPSVAAEAIPAVAD